MRFLYTLIFHVSLPLVLLRLYWRGRKAPDYRLRWRERLGIYPGDPVAGVIWVHAVSVGEVEAVVPLVEQLLQRYPGHPFLVTTTTPTGSARVRALLADRVAHVYLPYDLPWVLVRFFNRFRPCLAVFMEKEIWPNLFAACRLRNIPLLMINARLSARSARSYQKIPALIRPALGCIDRIATQTADDQARFIEIGASAEQVKVLGNIKFDLSIDPSLISAGHGLKQQVFARRFVWVIASTHHDEESLILSIYPRLKRLIPDLLLLIVPRHPERFTVVEKLCRDNALSVVMRSSQKPVTEAVDVYIADSVGELKMLYAAADLAFVGGSLVPVGGHNVLEPAAIGLPVIFGPQMFNFKEIAGQMLAADAAMQCKDVAELGDMIGNLAKDSATRQVLGNNAKRFVEDNQGAAARTLDLLAEFI